jgi:hypothetical protein
LSTAIDDLLTDIEMRTIHESVQTNENVQWWWVESCFVSKKESSYFFVIVIRKE